MKKRAGIFSPYWDSLGGGEKYTAAAVASLAKTHQVSLFWHDRKLVEKIKQRYGMELDQVNVDPEGYELLNTPGKVVQKALFTRTFDDFFWVSDGSVPWVFARNSLLHFQVPFQMKTSVLTKVKVRNFSAVLCNSLFTKKVIDSTFGTNAEVIYPPATMMEKLSKTNLILSVGRFDNTLQSKRHDVMLSSFKRAHFSGWKLVLAGGMLHGKKEVESLQAARSKGIAVEANPDFSELKRWYGQAKIYWHAAGFGVNEATEPEKVEHFGISTVEAMSAGAVPVVYAAGGQKEIVTHGKNGYLWQTTEELIAYTKELMSSSSQWEKLSSAAMKTSRQFSLEEFNRAFRHFIS